MLGTIEAVKENASIALFKFRSKTTWIGGGHCKTEIRDFYGATQEYTSRTKSFILDGVDIVHSLVRADIEMA